MISGISEFLFTKGWKFVALIINPQIFKVVYKKGKSRYNETRTFHLGGSEVELSVL
jgi:hypothetical protein